MVSEDRPTYDFALIDLLPNGSHNWIQIKLRSFFYYHLLGNWIIGTGMVPL